MPLVSLLASRDEQVLRILRRVLQDLGVDLLVSSEADEAADLLARRKFDAFIVDCDDLPGAEALLQSLRTGQSNRSSIVFALISGTTVRRAFELGANFVLDKPFTYDRATRSFRAAHGLMVRERRRYFRCEVNLPVTIDFGDNMPHQFTMTNLSEGGFAVRGAQKLRAGASVKVSFTLPDRRTVIDAKGEIAWASNDGRAGIRLLQMSNPVRQILSAWLTRIMGDADPVPITVNAARGWTKNNT